jgi:glycosyl transferase family 4/glycosyl transferase family 1
VNLLFISYRIHPDGSAEGINTAKLVGALRAAGHGVTLVTSDHNDLPAGVERPATALFRNVRVVRCSHTSAAGPGRWVTLLRDRPLPIRWLGRARELWPLATGLPLEAWAWADNAAEAAAALWRAERFDFVYTRAMKFWSHLAGLKLKRLGAPWVAHYNDPWPAPIHPGRDGRPRSARTRAEALQLELGRRVLGTADALTFPSRLLGEYLLSACGRADLFGRMFVVPHLMLEEPLPPGSPAGKMVLVHAGSLRSPRRADLPQRNVVALLSGLRGFLDAQPEARGNVHLDLLGSMDAEVASTVAAMNLGEAVRVRGRVPYDRLVPELRAASALVLVDLDMEVSLYPPSKLADYLAARRPILALTPARGEVRETLGPDGAIYAMPDDVAGIAAALARAFSAWRAGTLDARVPSDERRAPFGAAAIVKTLGDIARAVSRAAVEVA